MTAAHAPHTDALYTHVLFDLDGTLIDSAPSILAGFAAVLREHQLTPVRPLDESLIGPPLPETLMNLTGITDPERIPALVDTFKASYDTEGYRATRVYDGIAELLRSLHQQGVYLAIATNKRLQPTRQILEFLGWADYFQAVYALDMTTPRLPHKTAMLTALLSEQAIPRDRAVYIGDKPEDGHAATANGVPFIGVNWGYDGFAHPADYPADWQYIRQPQQLLGKIQKN